MGLAYMEPYGSIHTRSEGGTMIRAEDYLIYQDLSLDSARQAESKGLLILSNSNYLM